MSYNFIKIFGQNVKIECKNVFYFQNFPYTNKATPKHRHCMQ